MNFNKYFFIAAAVTLGFNITAQTLTNKKDGNYKFTVVKNLEATEVQNQAQSGTCWTFSSLSFFESELLRMGKPKVNLSEMFIVRNSYPDKADKYVRMHGLINFGPGGAFHDVAYVIKNYGIVPQAAYNGFVNGEKEINHNELDAMLKAEVDVVVKANKITRGWAKTVNATLDAYLGKAPETFDYMGKQYTPKSFAQSLGLDMNNYVELTSFTHHPFYTKFAIEVQDNWSWDEVYNVPLNELTDVIDNAIMNGYSVAWGADVSEKGFSFKNGVAIVPDLDWIDVKKEKIDSIILNPGKQKEITQAMRQEAFDNYETQDDHGMHIIGIVKDQNGTKYYIVKNSWGIKNNDCDGYFYVSEAFVKYKTTDIMLHKDAVKKDIAKKLGF
ncbi:MAG: aminopeptidase [Bacteroidetes bacterium RIFCSPLOWO2_12_FULL_35_15]|nr:MAG: aminopeptidase [Bacteroidetes bacterium RIFCSPLOWO2_12_FULL_35_15]